MEYTKYQFEEVVTLFDKQRIPLSSMERAKRPGKYRYYGAQGIIDYIDDYIFDGEYLLLAEDGENLKSNKQDLAQLVDGKFWVNNHAHILRTKEVCRLRYFYYWINNKNMAEYVTGSAQPKLSQASLKKMIIHLPSLEIQDRILNVITPIDEKIKENTKINENLEQQAATYFYHHFIANADPSWKEGTISDLGTVVGGSTPSKKKSEYYTDNGSAWITPKDLSVDKSKFISHGADDITELGLKNSSASIMPPGTVLFSSRAPIGYIAVADGEVTTNQGFKSVVPHSNVGTAFVYYFLKNALPTIENMASGSTFKEISGGAMRTVPAIIPDDERLLEFTDFCEPLFQQQRTLEAENRFLAALRDSLLPKLMSGELDVSGLDL